MQLKGKNQIKWILLNKVIQINKTSSHLREQLHLKFIQKENLTLHS
jgi:hypothetical protein